MNENKSQYIIGLPVVRYARDSCARSRLLRMLTALIITLNLAAAALIYLTSPWQRLLTIPLPRWSVVVGVIGMGAGLLTAITLNGIGAGIATALALWMSGWVVLPYLTWWRAPLQSS